MQLDLQPLDPLLHRLPQVRLPQQRLLRSHAPRRQVHPAPLGCSCCGGGRLRLQRRGRAGGHLSDNRGRARGDVGDSWGRARSDLPDNADGARGGEAVDGGLLAVDDAVGDLEEEGGAHLLGGGEALLEALLERLREQHLHVRPEAERGHGHGLDVLDERRLVRFGARRDRGSRRKGVPALDHHVEQDPHRPHIRCQRHRVRRRHPPDLLGAHVRRRALHLPRHRDRVVVVQRALREPEVDDHDAQLPFPLLDHHVGRLQVAVRDPLQVHRLHPRQDLRHQVLAQREREVAAVESLVPGRLRRRLVRVEQPLERQRRLNDLHHQHYIAIIAQPAVKKLYHILVPDVLQVQQVLRLSVIPLVAPAVAAQRRADLQSKHPPIFSRPRKRLSLRPIHLPHPATAKKLSDGVGPTVRASSSKVCHLDHLRRVIPQAL
mmetsp:Transcript_32447/g.76443  ORF Transcript_32447/g.76443 Transcript_32447/m.76443 type:complete len:433 (-) Transcript_32447:1358-2656(-)